MTGKDIRTLIWLKHRFIGDAVMATPLLRAVHDAGVEYSIIAAPHLAKLFEREPFARRIDPVGKVSGFGGFFRQVRSLKSGNFERVFLVNRSARSALIARFAGIAERVGHDTEGRGPLLTHRARYDVQKFEAACYGDLARLVRLDCDDSRVFLTGVGSERDAQTVGVQPGSTSIHKAILARHLAPLVDELHTRGKQVVFLGGKEEAASAEAVLALIGESDRIQNLVGQCSLPETMTKIESLGQIFCGDTGLVHIAAGLGTPSVSVFASTPSSKWGHHYTPHQVIDVGSPHIRELDPKGLIEAIR